ncbi:hypothetical protein [Pararhizobium qamdonense]|uniref:hypothetical protein n=1 Tax=Pararhizobium qamdonense TaxID=3031126 RepID=UPI0023E0F467|nr:hypothetical protein [Pararhizobium qamdonense]
MSTDCNQIANRILGTIEAMQDYDTPDAIIIDQLTLDANKPNTFTCEHAGKAYRVIVEEIA